MPAHPRRAARAESRRHHGTAGQSGANRPGPPRFRYGRATVPRGAAASTSARAARTIRNTSVTCTISRRRCTRAAIWMPPSRCIAKPWPSSAQVLGPDALGNAGRERQSRPAADGSRPLRRSPADLRRPRWPRAARRIPSRTSTSRYLLGDMGRLALARKQYARSGAATARSAADLSRDLAARPRLHGRCPDDARPRAAGVEQAARRRKSTLQTRAGRVVEGIRRRQSLVRAGARVSRTRVGHARAVRGSRAGAAGNLPGAGARPDGRAPTAHRCAAGSRTCIARPGGRSRRRPTFSRSGAGTRRAHPIALSSGSRARPQSRRIRRLARHPPTTS